MNILYFVHGFPPSIGAGAINAYKIVTYLAKFGHKILILSPGVFSKISPIKNMDNLSNLNVEVKYSSKLMKIPLNLIFSHFENMAKFILKIKSSFQPNIILSQYQAFHYASVVGGYVSKILKIPHIIRSHDIFFPTDKFSLPIKIFHAANYTRIYHSILNCNIFYVTTTEMKRYYLKFKKLQNVNFKIHHNGIDTTQFYPFKDQEQLKNEYGCDNLILFVGQISRDYDLQYIIKILPEILKTHKDTHFLIIGSGPHEKELMSFIRKKQLNRQIHLLGIKPHKDIPFYVNNCDIGIGRITYEKIWRYMIPVKCLEYMACGKPFITAPLSADLIKNNDVGLIIKRNFTERDIIDKLNILIEDKALRKRLGDKGVKKINNKFQWKKLMVKFNKEINEIPVSL
jgi:glycosyltransferase involved in cell wall biosynthesis